jgi:uncharacterized protein (DUF305 family)
MYGLMYLNTFTWGHMHLSETRLYMALVMGAAMAVPMLAFMRQMNAMIPHHSIAILTSERARLYGSARARVGGQHLAAQRREIREMKDLLADLARR